MALIPLHHPLPHPLSHGDMEGPQHPIMMTDGVSGMGEEEEGGGDSTLNVYLHHRQPYKTVYGIMMVKILIIQFVFC